MPLMSLVLRVMMTLSITTQRTRARELDNQAENGAHDERDEKTTMPSARLASTSARKKKAVKMAQKM
jgi:hypothetical protein